MFDIQVIKGLYHKLLGKLHGAHLDGSESRWQRETAYSQLRPDVSVSRAFARLFNGRRHASNDVEANGPWAQQELGATTALDDGQLLKEMLGHDGYLRVRRRLTHSQC